LQRRFSRAGCGWQQYSNTYYPGQNIGSLVGREIYIGYVFWKGNWWAWFDNQWIGYFPGSEWNNGYTKSALIQWFGEVSSENGVPPKTQMGDGILPPAPKAAHMLTLCDVDAAAWICWYRDQQSLTATVPNYYDIQHVGFGDTRYGGPDNRSQSSPPDRVGAATVVTAAIDGGKLRARRADKLTVPRARGHAAARRHRRAGRDPRKAKTLRPHIRLSRCRTFWAPSRPRSFCGC
jgi:hypothetical protein